MAVTATKAKPTAAPGGKGKGGGGSPNPKKQNTKKQQQQRSQAPKRAPKAAAVDPPLECSKADFAALLGDAAGLANFEEAAVELLDCARYGEVDACRAILDVWSQKHTPNDERNDDDAKSSSADGDAEQDDAEQRPTTMVDAKDASHSTPLHKACANGHASTVQLLLSRGASHAPNDSGNTPLHWAAGAGHAACVRLLLDHYDALSAKGTDDTQNDDTQKPLDVLLKNGFGRSALTEGFASGDTKTVEHLLNHGSAEEERLIGGLDKKEVGEAEAGEVATGGKREGKQEGIVHEFDFLRGVDEGEAERNDEERPSVFIRELPIAHADDPFGQAPIEDTTGLGVWCASLVMAWWLASSSMVDRMKGKSVLELGAGCGIPALTAAVHGRPASVAITDLNPETIENIRHNIGLNGCDTEVVTAASIDWGDESTYPPEKLDFVVCSDCIYQKDIVPLLKRVAAGLLKPNGSFLYVAPDGGRDGLPEFIAAMKADGFECVREEAAPEAYKCNPLSSGDDEDCFLHFGELAGTTYVLYEFRRC
ncbi:hypothetical protein ACHAXT_013078 [Thalassiosira profunda]